MSSDIVNWDPQFKPVKGIYEDRLRQFIDNGGDYRDLNLPKFYDRQRKRIDSTRVKVQYYQVPYDRHKPPVAPEKRPPWEEVVRRDRAGEIEWKDVYLGQPFGPSWSTTWFKVELDIPESWSSSGEQLVFEWDCENEGIVIDGDTLLPKTAFSGNGERTEYLLPLGRSSVSFYIECGNNGMFGVGRNNNSINPPDDDRYFHLQKADLVWPNWQARALYIDFWMLGDAARELPDNSWQKHRARELGNLVMNMFDPEDVSTVDKCRKFLQKEFFDKYTDDPKVYQQGDPQVRANVYAMGNCHIDTAWLWPFAETKRKIVRSWTSQCTLMDEFPEYQFVASQGQQFKWLLEQHPRFFKEVLVPRVQQAQFFPIGGSWVENDTNIPNGESLCRQFFYGQRFFMKHFGLKSDIFWLPDTFGYSSQVPQICRISGITKFLTQKLSWNNINSFPHSTFNWSGIDGSMVLTHMPPGNTYTASSHFGDVLRSANQNKSNEHYGTGLMLYGYGDGGGGPTREMLNKMRRIRSMSNRNGNVVPKLEVGKSVNEFYDDIMQKTDNGNALATWTGELYFEFHRGTYTTQADVKRLMRLSEVKIHDLEWIATKVSLLAPNKYTYPVNDINALWEDILLCQFHDVLPGTCIEMVYKYEAIPMLNKVVQLADRFIERALEALNTGGESLVPIGTLQWDNMAAENADAQESVFYPASVSKDSETIILNNKKLQVTFEKNTGVIKSIKDLFHDLEFIDTKHGRNKIGANQFVLFDDQPLFWQAWDTELYSVNKYQYLQNVESVTVVQDCKDVCSVETRVSIAPGSTIISTVSLSSLTSETLDDAKVDIVTKVINWNQRNKFLKVEFPVSIFNDFASYETQYGITRRPTHYNTSWDVAKFEVCQHKFTDYSDYTKGVSVLNDSKYGFSTHGNLMRLSLLRSSKAPDENADMGTHKMRYAIYPHKGGLTTDTVRLGLEFNYSYKYGVHEGLAKDFRDIISITGDKNVILANLKRGEDDEALKSDYSMAPKPESSIVVRVYESLGGESVASLLTSLKVKKVLKVNSLELDTVESLAFKTPDESTHRKFEIPIKLRQFEIATYKIMF
ncbi:AGR385Cp [Eremothecium gossypii ATCC 10895]|uniref:Alpha-mannosidase n=1 Tax=Eremothecium gossypii (strain ATCC 10895 / CBS 109.51 / FGSC 9923 / NRRL Y-1056) TaxID=284811 RepID=Q74Z21_EREGS|nr:AGR385Cp [Eremothecium gossypii ATCC 10895]AAS54875.2 AGR385Cp [Eremothecium gossypii ATCC 10895]AEY99207.1 FAGR385Cp [Eremothecium gossypii FDAG1]